MLKMTEICQVRDKPKMVQLFFPVLKKPFWLKTILRYFMLQWRSRKNFITYRLCSELIVISLHRACACSLQAYGPKSLSLQALKNTDVWTTLDVDHLRNTNTKRISCCDHMTGENAGKRNLIQNKFWWIFTKKDDLSLTHSLIKGGAN